MGREAEKAMRSGRLNIHVNEIALRAWLKSSKPASHPVVRLPVMPPVTEPAPSERKGEKAA
jgi:hypothetical protein